MSNAGDSRPGDTPSRFVCESTINPKFLRVPFCRETKALRILGTMVRLLVKIVPLLARVLLLWLLHRIFFGIFI